MRHLPLLSWVGRLWLEDVRAPPFPCPLVVCSTRLAQSMAWYLSSTYDHSSTQKWYTEAWDWSLCSTTPMPSLCLTWGKGSETREDLSSCWPCVQSLPPVQTYAACCSALEFPQDRSVNSGDIHYGGLLQLVRDLVTPESSSKNNTTPDILALIKLASYMLLT